MNINDGAKPIQDTRPKINEQLEQAAPSMGRVVIYNHPGSAGGKYPPMQSPAIVMKVADEDTGACDLFVMSNSGGMFFPKSILPADGEDKATKWEWPRRVK